MDDVLCGKLKRYEILLSYFLPLKIAHFSKLLSHDYTKRKIEYGYDSNFIFMILKFEIKCFKNCYKNFNNENLKLQAAMKKQQKSENN